MGNKAVCDTGPIIHLQEINLIKVFDLDKEDYRTYAIRDIQEWA